MKIQMLALAKTGLMEGYRFYEDRKRAWAAASFPTSLPTSTACVCSVVCIPWPTAIFTGLYRSGSLSPFFIRSKKMW